MNWSMAGMDEALRSIKDRLAGMEFDDPNTADAGHLSAIAETLGLRVVYDEHQTPVRIEGP